MFLKIIFFNIFFKKKFFYLKVCEETFKYIEGNFPQTSVKSETQQEIFPFQFDSHHNGLSLKPLSLVKDRGRI